MSVPILQRKITITNPQGLHMRPLAAFVQAANQFPCDVFVSKHPSQRINGKSMIHLLGLAAESGTELLLEVSGPEADKAIDVLMDILARHYDD
jgi:phosphotransferase system HPr (HPr) family protein